MRIEVSEATLRWSQWLLVFVASAGSLLSVLLLLIVTADPFHFFRYDNLFVVDRKYQRVANAGLIRTAPKSENVIVGSSFSANFNPQQVSEIFGGKTLLISALGGGAGDLRYATSFSLKKRPGLRHLFIEYPIAAACETGVQKRFPFPEGIYLDRPFAIPLRLLSFESLSLAVAKLASIAQGQLRSPFSDDVGQVHRWYEAQAHLFDKPDRINALYPQTYALFHPRPSREFIEAAARRLASCYYDDFLRWRALNETVEFLFFSPPWFQWELWSLSVAETVLSALRQNCVYRDRGPRSGVSGRGT